MFSKLEAGWIWCLCSDKKPNRKRQTHPLLKKKKTTVALIHELCIYLSITQIEYFGNCAREICMNKETEWGSAYGLLTVICSAYEGSTRPHYVLPLKRFTGKREQNPSMSLSLCEFSHLQLSQQTHGEMGWIINTPRSWQEDWHDGEDGGDGEGGKSLGRWECICNKAALGFHFIVLGGFWRQMCRLHSGDRLPLCISFIIHIRIPPYHHPIIFFQLALSPLPFGLSLIRVCRVSHARDTHRI